MIYYNSQLKIDIIVAVAVKLVYMKKHTDAVRSSLLRLAAYLVLVIDAEWVCRSNEVLDMGLGGRQLVVGIKVIVGVLNLKDRHSRIGWP